MAIIAILGAHDDSWKRVSNECAYVSGSTSGQDHLDRDFRFDDTDNSQIRVLPFWKQLAKSGSKRLSYRQDRRECFRRLTSITATFLGWKSITGGRIQLVSRSG